MFCVLQQYCSLDILVKQRCLKRKQVLVKKLRIVKNERNRSEPTEIMLMWPNIPATWTWYVASVAHNRNMPSISVYKIHKDIFVPYKNIFFNFYVVGLRQMSEVSKLNCTRRKYSGNWKWYIYSKHQHKFELRVLYIFAIIVQYYTCST